MVAIQAMKAMVAVMVDTAAMTHAVATGGAHSMLCMCVYEQWSQSSRLCMCDSFKWHSCRCAAVGCACIRAVETQSSVFHIAAVHLPWPYGVATVAGPCLDDVECWVVY